MIDVSRFHVITVISNPALNTVTGACGYRRRYELFHQFLKHMRDSLASVTVVELAFGRSEFEIRDDEAFQVVRLRSYEEYWHKENLINIGLQRLPHDWKYVAWIDADIQFQHPSWIEMTVNQLQRHMVIQMWENCIDLGPQQQLVQMHKSFMSQYVQGGFRAPIGAGQNYGYYGTIKGVFWHPGYAWAARREAIEIVGGGLLDEAALGSGDHHMAHALIGEAHRSYPSNVTAGYKRAVLEWQEMAEELKRDVGYIPVTITHWWHGQKSKRFYQSRWDIITSNQFDPFTDLKYDSQGLYQLEVKPGDLRMIRFRDQARAYLAAREEDSIDLDTEPLI